MAIALKVVTLLLTFFQVPLSWRALLIPHLRAARFRLARLRISPQWKHSNGDTPAAALSTLWTCQKTDGRSFCTASQMLSYIELSPHRVLSPPRHADCLPLQLVSAVEHDGPEVLAPAAYQHSGLYPVETWCSSIPPGNV